MPDMLNFLIRKLRLLTWGLLLAFLFAPEADATDLRNQQAPGNEYRGRYSIKEADVLVPASVKLGQYQRITRPYQNWILVCDENLEKNHRLCNITQSIVDDLGQTIFSWSLAASQGGAPVLIMRTPPQVGATGSVSLDLQDGGLPLNATIKGCSGAVCIAYQAVNDRISRAISNGYVATLKFKLQGDSPLIAIDAPLSGLNEAISGI